MIKPVLHIYAFLRTLVLSILIIGLLAKTTTISLSIIFSSDKEITISFLDYENEQEEEQENHENENQHLTYKQFTTLQFYNCSLSLLQSSTSLVNSYDSIDLDLFIPPPET